MKISNLAKQFRKVFESEEIKEEILDLVIESKKLEAITNAFRVFSGRDMVRSFWEKVLNESKLIFADGSGEIGEGTYLSIRTYSRVVLEDKVCPHEVMSCFKELMKNAIKIKTDVYILSSLLIEIEIRCLICLETGNIYKI